MIEHQFRLDELIVNDWKFHEMRKLPDSQGRILLARFTWGHISGLGWGFLHPWQQLALFPDKGTQAGIGHPDRFHERFFSARPVAVHRQPAAPAHGLVDRGPLLAWHRLARILGP